MRIIGSGKNLRIFWNNRAKILSHVREVVMAVKTTLSVEAAIEELMMDEDSERELVSNDEATVDEEESVFPDKTPAPTNVCDMPASSSKSTTVPSAYSMLRPPTSSQLSRKRAIDRNPPPKGKKRAKGPIIVRAIQNPSLLNSELKMHGMRMNV